MMIETLVDYGNREDWLMARNQGVGASESAALFGISPWETPYSLWAKKTGRVEEDGPSGEWIRWGSLLEGPIASRYQELTGRIVEQAGQYAVAQHPTISCMRATPDRFVTLAPDRTPDGLLQIKNTNAFNGHDWDDGPPDFIQVQVQHEMACTGRSWASVAVLIGGAEFRHFDVERNDSFITELEAQCQWFWEFVQSDQPPPIDGSDRTLEVLKKLHPLDNGQEVTLPPDAIKWWAQLEAAKVEIKAATSSKTEAEAFIKAAIGSATFGLLPDGRRLSLKTSSNPGHNTPTAPYTYRTLRIESATPAAKKRRRG